LVVDDEPDLLKLASLFLVLSGYEVATAASGEEALEIQNRQPAELVISDAVMPGMKGPALLNTIRQATPTTALVMMSGYSLEELPQGASFLPKPFRPDQLIAVAAQALALAMQAQEVVARECQRADELRPQTEQPLNGVVASDTAKHNPVQERKGEASETTGPEKAGRRASTTRLSDSLFGSAWLNDHHPRLRRPQQMRPAAAIRTVEPRQHEAAPGISPMAAAQSCSHRVPQR
jgi:CheY-like chemotaxis protein